MADLATMAVNQARYQQLKESEDQAYKMLGEHTLVLNRKYNADNYNADMDIPIFRKKDITESEFRHHQALYLAWVMIAEAQLKEELLKIENDYAYYQANKAEIDRQEAAATEEKRRKEEFQKFLMEE